MALEVEGEPILSQGEFRELIRNLRPHARGTGVLQAWFAGEPLSAEVVWRALDVEARLLAVTDRASETVQLGLERLARAFPEVARQ